MRWPTKRCCPRSGIEARRKRRFRITVEHHKMPAAAPDLVQRHFHADAPNRIWVGDVTFILNLNVKTRFDDFQRAVGPATICNAEHSGEEAAE